MTVARTARALASAVSAAVCLLGLPGTAWACSTDANAYFETFLDTTCLQAPLINTELGALGGLRLTTNRSEEHTSELQSHHDLVCRLLLEKKKTKRTRRTLRVTAARKCN